MLQLKFSPGDRVRFDQTKTIGLIHSVYVSDNGVEYEVYHGSDFTVATEDMLELVTIRPLQNIMDEIVTLFLEQLSTKPAPYTAITALVKEYGESVLHHAGGNDA